MRNHEMNNLLKILLAIFLPPVCAFIQVGLSLHFFINIVLTLLGGLPGMVGHLSPDLTHLIPPTGAGRADKRC